MKRLLIVILAATLGYSGWWVYAAQSMRASVEAWFEDRRAAGWDAGYAGLSVRGFPNRTDVTLTEPFLAAPDGSLRWSAPFFQILALSYRQDHVIIAWPDAQSLNLPTGLVEITSDGLRASVVTDGDLILRSNFEAGVLNITAPDGSAALAGVTVALQKIDLEDTGYRFAARADSVALSDPALRGRGVPDALAAFQTDARLTLDAPLSTRSLPQDPPNPTALDLRTAEITYGAFTFQSQGAARIDPEGRATGELSIEATNWREALAAAGADGTLHPELVTLLTDALELLSTFSGAGDTLDMTLRFLDGRLMFGPIPIADLPRLRWP